MKNKIIGIQGKSGSGKSTLLKLLMRFWDVNSGEIKISNENIKNINTNSLRDMESYVTQSTYLFNDTIKNNIKIAKENATMEEIIEASKKASLHEFIEKLQNDGNSNEYLNKLKDEDKYGVIRDALIPKEYNLIVTPKEIDDLIENMKDVIARGINFSL